MHDIYSDEFYQVLDEGSRRSARAVLPVAFEWMERFRPGWSPDTVLDVGCGSGQWLSAAAALGAKRLVGMDGPWSPLKPCDPSNPPPGGQIEFYPVDLEKGPNPDYFLGHDLSMCLEVLEHVSADAAPSWVDFLCDQNKRGGVLFSAATPGQGGPGHINERPLSYWQTRFARHRYFPVDFRWQLPAVEVASWYRTNTFLYTSALHRFHHFFATSAVISLPERRDRLDRFRERVSQQGFDPRWQVAVRGTIEQLPIGYEASHGAWGCLQSHLECYRHALAAGATSLFVFEDDAEFVHPHSFIHYLNDLMPEVPDDWQILYLGANHMEPPVPISPRCARVTRAFTTHAYAVREEAMRWVLASPLLGKTAIDVILTEAQKVLPSYCCTPSLVTQETGYSDIMRRRVDYTGVIR